MGFTVDIVLNMYKYLAMCFNVKIALILGFIILIYEKKTHTHTHQEYLTSHKINTVYS